MFKYCKKSLSNKSNLSNHQKTVKYCLKIQEKILETNTEKDEIVKDIKNKKLESELLEKDEIMRKMKDLEVKNKILESELNIYKELAKHNQMTVDKIATQPKNIKNTVINNKILNMIPFDLENSDFSEVIKNEFTKNYMEDGQKGVAKFA